MFKLMAEDGGLRLKKRRVVQAESTAEAKGRDKKELGILED